MGFHFQSIRSGSSGNCLLFTTGATTLLIDAGFRTLSGGRGTLGDILPKADGVVVSHLHTDHIHHYALRAIEELGVPLWVSGTQTRALRNKHFSGRPFDHLLLHGFAEQPLRIGEFAIRAFEVPHHPDCVTYGFEITCLRQGIARKAVVATDFWDWDGLRPWFDDADFIYLEANHDPELLRRHPQPNAYYHLSNPKCGALLAQAFHHSHAPPPTVMLGHLSKDRNEPALAQDTVWRILDGAGYGRVRVEVAPRHEPSEPVLIAP